MKIISQPGASRLVNAVLASTLFCAPLTIHAFVNLDAAANGKSSSDPAYLPGTGYNFTANGVTFTIDPGDNIGVTGAVSVDNIGNKIADNLVFAGNNIVTGSVGTTNPIDILTLSGVNPVFFQDDVKVGVINIINGGEGVFENNVTLTGNVDNISLIPNSGNLTFAENGLLIGNVGLSNPLAELTANDSQQITNLVEIQGNIINAANIFLNDNLSGIAAQGTTLQLNQSGMIVTGDITAATNNEDTLDILQPATINGDIGTNASKLNLIKVGATNDGTQINGNIFATTTTFQADKNLTLTAFNPTVTGNIDSTAAGTGTLIFKNGGTVTGTIGAVNPLNQIDLKGASITTVTFQGDINTTNGLLFLSPAQPVSTAVFGNNIIITGPIDNQTLINNIGTLNFTGNATVNGTIGATKSLYEINLTGGAGTTVSFAQNVNVGTGDLNFAAGSTPTTKASLADGVTLFGNVDNTSGIPNTGTLLFLGNGVVTGQIGATSPINQIIVTLPLTTNKIAELQGSLIQANSILINDNGTGIPAQGNTLKLNNPLMTLTVPGGITPLTANEDTIDIFNADTLSTNIGTLAKPLFLVKVGANNDTTLDGNIFAKTTQFQGNNTLFLEDDSIITGNVDAIAPSEGILSFLGDGTVTGTIGATNALNAVQLVGEGSTVNFTGNILNATPIYFLEDATVNIADGVNVSGPVDNLSGKDFVGTLSFLGDSIASNNIGETRPIEQIILGGVNKTVTLSGDVVNAQTIFFNDNGVLANTLVLDNAGLILTADLLPSTPGVDILEVLQSATINGDIGADGSKLAEVNISASTHVNGNIYADNTEFQTPSKLSLGNNSSVFGPVTTTVNNQGILQFDGNSIVNYPIGAPGFSLSAVNVNGKSTSTVYLNTAIFANDTNINSGTLQINGPQTINGNVNVNDGGNLQLSKTTTPLTVTGNFNLNDGSRLTLDFNNPITTPSVVAAGAANVNEGATLQVNNITTAQATNHKVYTVVSGNFASNIQPIPAVNPGILLSLKTEADNINHKLNLTINLLSPAVFANQSNTIGVATTLGGLIGDPNVHGLLGQIIDQLRTFTSIEQLNAALAELAPTVDGAVINHSFNAALQTFDIIAQRFYELPNHRIRKLGPTRNAYFEQGINFGDDNGWYDDDFHRDDKGRAFWVNIFGHYADQKEVNKIQGYRDGTWGLAAGADFIFTNQILAGFAVSWAVGNIHNAVAGDAKTQADSYQISLYGEYLFQCPLYMNWYTGLAYNDYDAFREVIFSNLHFIPQSIYHAWQYSAKAEFGYAQKLCCDFLAIPVVSLYYSLLDFKDYQEVGAGTANQWVNPDDANRLQGGLGVRLVYDHFYQKGILQPELRFRMLYNFMNDNMTTTSDFIGGGASFVTTGAKPPKASYNLGASITTFECPVVATFSYDYEFRKNYRSHSGFFRLRYEW